MTGLDKTCNLTSPRNIFFFVNYESCHSPPSITVAIFAVLSEQATKDRGKELSFTVFNQVRMCIFPQNSQIAFSVFLNLSNLRRWVDFSVPEFSSQLQLIGEF